MSSEPSKPEEAGRPDGEVNDSPTVAPDIPKRAVRGSPLASAWYAAARAAMLSPDAAPVPGEPSPELLALHMSSLKATADQAVEVPAYKLHPMDMYLIREAADKMNLSVADYAQIAPFLYAKFMRDVGW